MLAPLSLVLCLTAAFARSLLGVKVLITAPPSYADRLAPHLEDEGAVVLCCPTIVTEHFDDDDASAPLRESLSTERLASYDYVAFTSRRGIEAALRIGGTELVRKLDEEGVPPTAIALGADACALIAAGVRRSSILVPSNSSPDGIVASLSVTVEKGGMRVLCPVPVVTGGLHEPSVVPDFLAALRREGFVPEKRDAYRTRWVGPSGEAKEAVTRLERGDVDVVAITSTAEVEGLLLLCDHYGVRWGRCRASVVTHGPVTAAGARNLGVDVSAVSADYSSFAGMRDAVARCVLARASEHTK